MGHANEVALKHIPRISKDDDLRLTDGISVTSWKYAEDHDCDDGGRLREDSIIGGWDDEFDSYKARGGGHAEDTEDR